MSVLRHKVLTEEQDRQRLEETFMKKDDEIGKLRSTFDRSLNTLSGDAQKLQTILDKSLHKIDKHIMASNGLEVTDSEITSADEYFTPSKAPSNRLNVTTKLDKYRLPADHAEKTCSPTKLQTQNVKADSYKRGKNPSYTFKSKQNDYTPSKSRIIGVVPSSAAKRPQRPDRK